MIDLIIVTEQKKKKFLSDHSFLTKFQKNAREMFLLAIIRNITNLKKSHILLYDVQRETFDLTAENDARLLLLVIDKKFCEQSHRVLHTE